MAELGNNSKAGLVTALNGALADTLALYMKTKNFHWHVAGPRFRDLHLLFADQDDVTITADAMVAELRDDNRKLHDRLAKVKEEAEAVGDNATSGIVDDWIDQTEERIWFLNQTAK